MEWELQAAITGHSAPVYSCAADQQWIYSTAGDRFVTRWNPVTGAQDAFAVRLDSPAYCISTVHPALLVICCSNGTVIAIDTLTKQLLWEHNFAGKALFSCADCPEQQLMALGDAEGNLLLVDYAGNLLARFQLDCGKIRQLKRFGAFLFAACQDGSWRQFELPTFNELYRCAAHAGGVNALTYFPESFTLLTGGKDAHLRLWDILTGQELLSLPAHYQTIYGIEQLNDQQLATVSMDKTIKIWNTKTWKVEQRLEFKQGGHNRSVNGCIVRKEGYFVTFGDDKRIAAWKPVANSLAGFVINNPDDL